MSPQEAARLVGHTSPATPPAAEAPAASHSAGPWVLIQEDVRPFALVIRAADGEVLLELPRWARSSADKTLADCIACINFGSKDRDEAVAGNARQLADAALMASAPTMSAEIDRLRTALRAVRACTDLAWAARIISDALREETR